MISIKNPELGGGFGMTSRPTSCYDNRAQHGIETRKEGALVGTYEDYGDRDSGFYRVFCGD